MLCRMCGRPIVILINQGTGICCEMCRKMENGELTPEQIEQFIKEVNPIRWRDIERVKNATEA